MTTKEQDLDGLHLREIQCLERPLENRSRSGSRSIKSGSEAAIECDYAISESNYAHALL